MTEDRAQAFVCCAGLRCLTIGQSWKHNLGCQLSCVRLGAALTMAGYRMLGGNLGGAVFVCSAGTVQSCLQKGLLGMMQDTFVPIVQHVSIGMPVSPAVLVT